MKQVFFFHFSLPSHIFYNFLGNNSLAIHYLATRGDQSEVFHSTAHKGYTCPRERGTWSGAQGYKSGKSCVQYGGHIKGGVESPGPTCTARGKIIS